MRGVRWAVALAIALTVSCVSALPADVVHDLAFGEGDDRAKAIGALVAGGDPAALPLLQAMIDGDVQTVGDRPGADRQGRHGDRRGHRQGGLAAARERDDVVVNNRLRRTLATAIAAFKLASPDRVVRLAAAKELQNSADEEALPAIAAASAKEADPEVKGLLTLTQASIQLASPDRATRLAAIRALAQSDTGATKTLLLAVLEKKDGKFVEADDEVRAEAQRSLSAVEGRLAKGDIAARIFSGISLGTILLLAALGLAITYGLMGVINMAHGELIMIGAYATYVVQNLFRQYAPGAFDWYLLCAMPVAFAVSGLVGVVLERTVIRHLYGRPLETLLATWGLSLILIQAVRTIFGAQNVQVENPAWMSGGIEIMTNVVLPWSRVVIIAFAGGRAAAGVDAADAHAARPVRARRHAEPRDGERARRAHAQDRHDGVRPGLRHRRPRRLRAVADRQRRARTSARATSSTRSWWSCWAASASSPERSTRRSASASPTSSSRRGRARCSRRSRCSCSSSSSSRSGRRDCSR